MESHPDRWFRTFLRPKYDSALARTAAFLGSDPANLVFVPNITTGMNTILRCLRLEREDEIMHTSHTYQV